MRRTRLPGARLESLTFCALSGMLLAAGMLSGCGTQVAAIAPASDNAATPYAVMGGQQPVGHASIQIYAVGTTGAGSAATPLFATPTTTNARGQFNLAPYTCPSPETPVYLLATGGDPGLGTTNPAIAMLDAIGPCSSLATAKNLVVNEVTTVAGVWALAPYMHSMTEVGAAATDAAKLAAAFDLAAKLANPQAGVTPGAAAVPPGYSVPASTINTAADILSACVNSAGGTAGAPNACGLLFSYAQASTGKAPTDTIAAALAVAQHPTDEVRNIFGILPSSAPFQPQLTSAPPDWTISLVANAPAPTFAAAPGSGGVMVAIADAASNPAIFYTVDGSAPSAASLPYAGPVPLTKTTTLTAVAVVNGLTSPATSATYAVAPAPAKLAVLSQAVSGVAGAVLAPALVVAIEDADGNVVTSASGPVTLTASGGTLSGTATLAAVNGVATFADLTLPAAGSFTLMAQSGSLSAAATLPIAITAPEAAPLPLTTARSAAGFVDSVGIDVHFNYYGSIYTNDTPLMIASLQALHISHLRDAMCWQGPETWNTFYALHQQLGALGFKTDYVPAMDEPLYQVAAYPALVPDMEAVEPANEWDISGDPDWAGTVKTEASAIYKTIKAANPKVTVLAPSLAFPVNAAALGDVSATADAGNLHGYFGGFNPGSSTINPSIYLGQVHPETPSEPIWVTETGYFAQPGPFNGTDGVPAAVQAIYSPRALLEWANAGVARTYLYELADDEIPGEDANNYHWGLLNADGTPKPAFHAVANLLTLLSDDAGLGGFKAAPLALKLDGADGSVHQALFEKADGSYYLALWVEAQGYDFHTQQTLAVPPQKVTIDIGRAVSSATAMQWDAAGAVTGSVLSASQKIGVTVSDRLLVVKLALR